MNNEYLFCRDQIPTQGTKGAVRATNRAPIGDRKAPWWICSIAYMLRCSGLGRCRRISLHGGIQVGVRRDC